MSVIPSFKTPKSGGDPTSAWYTLHYIKTELPNISNHDLVQLAASIGAETKGHYTFSSVEHATAAYKAGNGFPSTGGKWRSYVGRIIVAADKHGKKNWISGFAYSSSDIPGTGGPSTIQQAADSGAASSITGAFSGIGKLFSGSNLIGILILVVILIVLLGRK